MEEKASSASSCRPTISFPLGIALLVIILLLITAVLLCYLYWDRLRSFLFSTTSSISNQQHNNNITTAINVSQSDFRHEKPIRPHHMMGKQDDRTKNVTVVMPGDDVPKFIGMACPCKPPVAVAVPVPENFTVVVHKIFDDR